MKYRVPKEYMEHLFRYKFVQPTNFKWEDDFITFEAEGQSGKEVAVDDVVNKNKALMNQVVMLQGSVGSLQGLLLMMHGGPDASIEEGN